MSIILTIWNFIGIRGLLSATAVLIIFGPMIFVAGSISEKDNAEDRCNLKIADIQESLRKQEDERSKIRNKAGNDAGDDFDRNGMPDDDPFRRD